MLWAFRQAEQIVRLLAIGFSLKVFVAEPAHCHNHIHRSAVYHYVKGPLTGLNSGDSVFLFQFPPGPITVQAADVGDSLVNVHAITFVDALDSYSICRLTPRFKIWSSPLPGNYYSIANACSLVKNLVAVLRTGLVSTKMDRG